jgi:hypothetical protein
MAWDEDALRAEIWGEFSGYQFDLDHAVDVQYMAHRERARRRWHDAAPIVRERMRQHAREWKRRKRGHYALWRCHCRNRWSKQLHFPFWHVNVIQRSR